MSNLDDGPKFTIGKFNDDTLLLVHDISMSKDPVRACEGRFAKAIVPALDAWIESELKRRDPPVMLLTAGLSGSLSVFFTCFVNAVPLGAPGGSEARRELLRCMRDAMVEMYDRNIEEACKPDAKV